MAEDIRTEVRRRYGSIAQSKGAGAGCGCGCGCGPQREDKVVGGTAPQEARGALARIPAIPLEADMGLGCGNPTALAALLPGETVIDLGSGGGIDCFLASRAVGPAGKVIGVDMTAAMIERARKAASTDTRYANVEFRLGEIENLPVKDGEADVIISNCVVNLSPDKAQVFREAYRALKRGGRVLLADIVLSEKLPEAARGIVELWTGCVSGALPEAEYLGLLADAGFGAVEVTSRSPAAASVDPEQVEDLRKLAPGLSIEELRRVEAAVQSVHVRAVKP